MRKRTSELFTFHLAPFKDKSGMALVLTLMVVAIITAMVVEFAYGVYVNTAALHNWQTSQELSVTARSATKLASRLIADNLRSSYTKGVFEMSQKIPFEDLDGAITLRIEDENAKFNLNSLKNPDGYDFFVRLLDHLNLNPDIANKVSYWINASTEHRPRDFADIRSKNAYLDSVDELLLIPGIDRESYDKLAPYVTIYGSSDGMYLININTAAVPVLWSLSDRMTEDLAKRIVDRRELAPFKDPNEIFGVSGFAIGMIKTQYATTQGSSFHVIATADSGGVKRIVESVLEGNSVRYWKEM